MRILHVGLGPLGRAICRDVHARGLGEVAAAVDVAPDLAGRPLGELVPETGSRAPILDDLDAALAAGPFDACVVTTSSWLADCADTFRALLAAGLTTVSTCEELLLPRRAAPDLADELDALAREHDGRLMGTGVNPGFLMDLWPLVATAVCRDVRSILVERVQDASSRRLPFQRKIGVGLTPGEFEERARTGRFGHAGLTESLLFLADHLGLAAGEVETTLEPLVAHSELASGLGIVAPGRVRGLRQTARAHSADGRAIALEFVAAVGIPAPVDRVRIEGDPDLEVAIPGGVHGDTATAAITLNAIPSLLAAPPGLHTMADVRPVRWYH